MLTAGSTYCETTMTSKANKHDPRGYEFSTLENQAFTRLAVSMQLVALLELGAAAVYLPTTLGHLRRAVANGAVQDLALALAWLLIPVMIAAWTFRAGSHLRLIVRTEGDDISHLMGAVGELNKLYLLQLVLFVVAAAIIGWTVMVQGALG
jgi:hypothetical protein